MDMCNVMQGGDTALGWVCQRSKTAQWETNPDKTRRHDENRKNFSTICIFLKKTFASREKQKQDNVRNGTPRSSNAI